MKLTSPLSLSLFLFLFLAMSVAASTTPLSYSKTEEMVLELLRKNEPSSPEVLSALSKDKNGKFLFTSSECTNILQGLFDKKDVVYNLLNRSRRYMTRLCGPYYSKFLPAKFKAKKEKREEKRQIEKAECENNMRSDFRKRFLSRLQKSLVMLTTSELIKLECIEDPWRFEAIVVLSDLEDEGLVYKEVIYDEWSSDNEEDDGMEFNWGAATPVSEFQ